jgi:hypothetical protein
MLIEKQPSSPEPKPVAATDLSFVDKSKFLMRGGVYRPPVPEVIRRETHMSEVFLAGDRVYKLKKPVRFPYLDFSTLARREAACRAELELNRRLAPTSIAALFHWCVRRMGLRSAAPARSSTGSWS